MPLRNLTFPHRSHWNHLLPPLRPLNRSGLQFLDVIYPDSRIPGSHECDSLSGS